MIYSAYFFSSKCLTVSVPPSSLSLTSGQYWAHLFFGKIKKAMLRLKSPRSLIWLKKQNVIKSNKKQLPKKIHPHTISCSIIFFSKRVWFFNLINVNRQNVLCQLVEISPMVMENIRNNKTGLTTTVSHDGYFYYLSSLKPLAQVS